MIEIIKHIVGFLIGIVFLFLISIIVYYVAPYVWIAIKYIVSALFVIIKTVLHIIFYKAIRGFEEHGSLNHNENIFFMLFAST